jgi:site-specific DNA-adenine methylase
MTSPVTPADKLAAMPLAEAPPVLGPPLKWAGGKRWQLPHLRPLWEPHSRRRIIEPFAGGLAVTLGLVPERALLNDANPHLIHFYGWLKRGLKTNLPMENDERLFYQHRARFNELVAGAKGRQRRSGRTFLLPQSDRVQRPVPFQSVRRVQCPIRPLEAHRLQARFF